jgi:hypothetical protein
VGVLTERSGRERRRNVVGICMILFKTGEKRQVEQMSPYNIVKRGLSCIRCYSNSQERIFSTLLTRG